MAMVIKSIEIDTTTDLRGVADGYAELDSEGKVPVTQLPAIIKRESRIDLVPLESEVVFSS